MRAEYTMKNKFVKFAYLINNKQILAISFALLVIAMGRVRLCIINVCFNGVRLKLERPSCPTLFVSTTSINFNAKFVKNISQDLL